MSKVLVAYYTRTGNTKKMAQRVAEGARDAGGEVDLKSVEDVDVDDLPDYDALIIGSPTYYGQMSWEVKKLFDDSVKYQGELEGMVGGAFSSSANMGGGNETTVMSILEAMLIHGMIIRGTSTGDHYGPTTVAGPEDRAQQQCRELGERVTKLADT
ncbi:MAG: flavodoxin family protein, partial [Candidatus Brocadiia bacterium]